jgi:alkylation response protein AidB-like acyl-CoA dehydrogenase
MGGAGRDYVSYAHAVEAVSFASATVAVILTVQNSLVAEPLLQFGSDLHKETWLRRLAQGKAIGAFALSEANAGSDAATSRPRRGRTATATSFTAPRSGSRTQRPPTSRSSLRRPTRRRATAASARSSCR